MPPAHAAPRTLSLARRRHHPAAGRAERRVRHVRAGDRLVAQAAAEGDGAGRAAGRPDRARPRRRSRPLPLDRPDRHHPDRNPRRRLFGREPRRAGRRSGWPCSASTRTPRTTLGFALVIVLTTYASLVIGELVPKQFALRAPEPIAASMALPMLLAVAGDRAVRLAARPDQRARSSGCSDAAANPATR